MRNIIVSLSIIAFCNNLNAQSNQLFWNEISESKINITGKRDIIPEKFKTFQLDLNALKSVLLNAPNDKHVLIDNSNLIVSLPLPTGEIQKFKVVEAPVMDMVLQLSYPNIKTYSIKGIDDVYANGKIDVTEFGFHGMIRSAKGDIYIDPYCQKNISDYITYYTHDFIKPTNDRGICEGIIDEDGINSKISSPSALICAGANLRTYRLAIACTGEYAKAATGLATPTKAQTLAKVVISVNRVDGVYEAEVAVRLVLVATSTLVMFTVPGTGFTVGDNNTASSLITKSQSVITASVGTANFDIGHTFSTGGGGLANLGCVCNASSKAKGITGSASPVGDPYDIDYVSHEIGHQFSGNHTFRAATGSCAGNGNLSTSVEPGSGVSIMAYAGICTGQNITTNSIPYFHGISFGEIMAFTTSGGGSSCDVSTASGNGAPVVTGSAAFTVPANTPFILTGSATDPNGDALTYQWEEIDAASSFGNWNAGTKPFFRSYAPSTSPTRMFPILSAVLSGNLQGTVGEYTPMTAQVLNFRLTARDNKMGGGGVCSADAQITVNGAGPFAVTSQSVTGLAYSINAPCDITWSVNGTDVAPVNCSLVNIYISKDAGATFTLMIANTPNDGFETITLPNLPVTSTTCRVKVESVGNIFFDINDKNFTISTVIGLGINEQNASNPFGIQLYPNPFSNSVKVDIRNNSNLMIEKTVINVYDIVGHIVRTEVIKLNENFSKVFDFSDLANGSYVVEVTDGKQKSVARLIKM